VRITEGGARRCRELMTPLIEEGGREVAAKYSVEQLALVVDFLRAITDIQRRHVDRLRGQPSPRGRK